MSHFFEPSPFYPADVLLVAGASLFVSLAAFLLFFWVRRWWRRNKFIAGIIFFACAETFLLGNGALGWAYALHPQMYVVDNERGIGIQRPFSTSWLPWETILGIRRGTDEELRDRTRVEGVAGGFGYFGEWRSSGLGTFYPYARNMENPIVITTREKIYVISPESAEKMLYAVSECMARKGETEE
jgi:hypothetical protein